MRSSEKISISKKLMVVLTVISLMIGSVMVDGAENQSQDFRELTVDEMVLEMGMGINLGNTFDGHTGLEPNETLWQNVKTSQAYMDAVHDYGFNTIRIPVTWGTMINEDFSIDEQWISRVQDVVDYAVGQGMYVIINIHHDGAEQMGWLLVESDHPEQVLSQFSGVWNSIATYFKDYDEHLIFESMNEVWGHSQTILEDMEMINRLNQVFVDTVRVSGGNNDRRWLSVPGRYTNIDVNTDPKNGFEVPGDSVENRIFVSVHDYPMGMGLTQSMGATEYSETMAGNFANKVQKLMDAYTGKGIPVILGEYGTMNKGNTLERAYYYETVNRLCAAAGIVPVAWDNGSYDLDMDPDYSMALIDRASGQAIYPEIIDAMLRGTYSGANDLSLESVIKPTEDNIGYLKDLEDIGLDADSYSISLDQRLLIEAKKIPSDSDSILLWSSDDRHVVNVSNGWIEGTGLGQTTVRVYNLDKSVTNEIQVTVTGLESDIPCDKIVVNSTMTLTEGNYKSLFATNGTEGSNDRLTYRSLDESIASVNAFGKVVGIKPGTCEIIIQASSGLEKSVQVNVKEKEIISDITIAINVYFNDGDANYFGNETGQAVQVNGDGTYKLTFDSSQHIKEAGVKGLNNIGAVYIKDVASGTVLTSCNIFYKSITIDGQPMTVIQEVPKSALKDSGIFDTNDPLNAWDGSQITEVIWDQSAYTVNIEGIDNPQVIEVVFELSDMQFKGSDQMAGPGSLNLYDETTVTDIEESQEGNMEAGKDSDTSESDNTGQDPASDLAENQDTDAMDSQDSIESEDVSLLPGLLYVLIGLVLAGGLILGVKKIRKDPK